MAAVSVPRNSTTVRKSWKLTVLSARFAVGSWLAFVKLLSLQGLDAEGIERRVRERFSHLVGAASAASATT